MGIKNKGVRLGSYPNTCIYEDKKDFWYSCDESYNAVIFWSGNIDGAGSG